jgi:hypothetical protein
MVIFHGELLNNQMVSDYHPENRESGNPILSNPLRMFEGEI